MALFIVPTLVQASRQTVKVPHMSSPHERQLKEHNQKIKREHDIRFLESEEHLQMEGDIYEDWMDTTSTTTITRRFTSYWIGDEKSGNIASFSSV